MKNFLLALSFLTFSSTTGFAQQLVSIQQLSTTPVTTLRFLYPDARYGTTNYKVVYNTMDVDGSTVQASGILVIPQNVSCAGFPLGAYLHGTVMEKNNVPSRDNNEAFVPKIMASLGVIAVAPDYLGLGDAPGLHPYLHAESQATATLDLIRAVREYLQDSTSINLNGEVYVTGYSQGGHAAMGTVKYIQDNNLLTEFEVVGAGPASGPYNLSGSQSEVFINDDPYSNPAYSVYLLFGMNRAYGNIFNSYDEILKSPYDTLIPPYFDGNYDVATVNALLPDTISGYVQDSVLANFRADSLNKQHPIWQALIKNDNYDWNPSFPMELYYCTMDEQVNYQNALDAEAAMQAKGAQVTAVNKGALNHGDCVLPALDAAAELMDSLTVCGYVSLMERLFKPLQLYPNPARTELMIQGVEDDTRIEIYNMGGKRVASFSIGAGELIPVATLPAGTYLLRTIEKRQSRSLKFQVID